MSKRARDDEAQGPPSKRLKVAFTGQDTIDDEDTYEEAVRDLKSEWKKGRKSRSQARMKQLMSKTGPMRRKWITEVRPLVSDVLLKFPCLTQSRVVRTEIHKIMVMSVIINSSLLAASTGVLFSRRP